ncbi:MAG: tetratricopeptide repeat protein [Nitrospirae bacterium]|nr:tetratricopeptide repeat protein [Nitrospirota bacterium]
MIVKNEEEVIGRALSSVQQIADEIIVVDTGSTDRTVEEANRFNARVFPFNWNDDFSEAKNFSISKASGDWILVLDADEAIAGRDLSKISELIKTQKYAGYTFILRNYSEKSNIIGWLPNPMDYEESMSISGFHPFPLVRLFRNGLGIRYKGRIHETLEDSMKDKGLQFQDSHIPIHHYGFMRGEDQFKNKLQRYALLEEKRAREYPGNTEYLLRASRLNIEAGLLEKAEQLLNELLDSKPGFGDAYHELALLSEEKSDDLKSEKFYLKALRLNSDNAMFQYNFANFLVKRGRADEALKFLLNVIRIKPAHFNAHYMLGEIFFKNGDINNSLLHFREVIRVYPNHSIARHNLGVAYYLLGKKKEASEEFMEAVRINPQYSMPRFYLGLIYAETGKREDAKREIGLSVKYDPGNEEARRILEML